MNEAYIYAYEKVIYDIEIDSERKIKIMKDCIANGVDINYDDSYALINAIECEQNNVIDFLLENGIDFKKNEYNVLYSAINKNNYKITKKFLDLGADPNIDDIIYEAKDIQIVKLLIEYGIDPLIKPHMILNYYSDSDKYFDIIEYFLSIGLDPSFDNNYPIKYAFLCNSNIKIKCLLLSHGADPNAIIGSEKMHNINCEISLLEKSLLKMQMDDLKLLFDYGADINLCNNIIKNNKVVNRKIKHEYNNITVQRLKPFIALFLTHGLDITEFVYMNFDI